jgi:hypothetical protein
MTTTTTSPTRSYAPPDGTRSTDVYERLEYAARVLHSYLRMCRLESACVVAAWLSLIVAPPISYAVRSRHSSAFGDSPASSMLLLVLTSAAPLALGVMRFATTCRVPTSATKLRVDRMANAPRCARQIAYVADTPALAWWFWCGYVLGPLCAALNVATALVWLLVVDATSVLFALVVALSVGIAYADVRLTQWFYDRAIQSNFEHNIAIEQRSTADWAHFRADEARRKWFGGS